VRPAAIGFALVRNSAPQHVAEAGEPTGGVRTCRPRSRARAPRQPAISHIRAAHGEADAHITNSFASVRSVLRIEAAAVSRVKASDPSYRSAAQRTG